MSSKKSPNWYKDWASSLKSVEGQLSKGTDADSIIFFGLLRTCREHLLSLANDLETAIKQRKTYKEDLEHLMTEYNKLARTLESYANPTAEDVKRELTESRNRIAKTSWGGG